MFNLDISTIRLCAVMMVLVTLVSLIAFWRFKDFKANAAWWSAGIVVYSLAFLGALFLPLFPYRFTSMIVEAGLITCNLLFLNAVRVKLQKPPLLKSAAALVLLATASFAWFLYVAPNAFVRIQTIFLISALVTLTTAWEMLRNARHNWQKPYLACAFLFLFNGIFNVGSFVYYEIADVVSFNFVTVLLLFTTVLIALLNHAFILMAYEDLRQDLDWAMQQLRKESELKLKSLQDRWLLALDYGKSGAWEVNLLTAEAVLSAHWMRLLGLPAEELRCTTVELMQYMHPEDVDSFLNLMKDLELGHTEYLEHEHRLRRNNGTWIWVCSRGRIIQHPDLPQDPILVGIDIDITESKLRQVQLEQAIAASDQAKEVALQASKAKTTFLTNISHEIRTPMNAILGFSQLLLDDTNLTDKQKESLEIITSSGVHLMSLIDDILNLSRVQSGHYKIRRELVNPLALFQEISSYFQKRNVRLGVRFETVLAADLPQALQMDPKAVRQICMNLLSNAFKFTQSGKVELRVDYVAAKDPLPAMLVIKVSDTGIGIREEHLGIIFNVFEQGGSQSFTDEGVGLGLAICKDIVSQLDGTLEVLSRLNEGSCFIVSIPVDEVVSAEVRVPQTVATDNKQQVPRILIVDDIESNRKLLQRILGDKGYEIQEASNAGDAMTLIRTWQPSLVLMDIRMPIVAGDQAIIEIRKDKTLAAMPIIAITANAFEGEKERLIAIGANEFISKPFMRDEILQKIGKLLEAKFGKKASPLRQAPLVAAAASPLVQPQPPKPQGVKVLVVDDNPANQQLLLAQLRTMDLHAEAARNGREAFNSWNQHHHEMVLTDCAMPLLDGFELAKLIRQSEAEQHISKPTIIIAVTGSPEEYSERCLESGMNDLIGKPVLLSGLVKTLGRYLPQFKPKPL
jgi:PAS domain S-box-containing protein